MKKRKDGLYQKQHTIHLPDGSKKLKVFYGKSPAEVNRKILEFNGEQLKGRLFSVVADEWQESHEKEIEYYTADCYKAPLKDVKAEFENYYIKNITPTMINNFIIKFSKRGYARQTVKLRLIVLNLIFKHAVLKGDITDNPAQYIKPPSYLTSKTRDCADDSVVERIKASKELLPMFLLYTGCRPSEALAVKYEDIDFENNKITINKAVIFQNEKPVLRNKTKTSKSNREIILLNPLKAVLPKSKKGFLFKTKDGLYTKKQLRDYWNSLKLGITAYQLRHTYITILYEAGVDAEIAMTQTGHSNISTMRNIYTHIRNAKKQETENKLNQYLEQN